jgi:PAS domain S-box-containing protein
MKLADYFKNFVPILMVILLYVIAIFIIIIPYFHQQLLNQKKETIKELTVNSISLLEYFNKQVENGVLNLDTAKEVAKNEIKSLRYGKNLKDYFWIIDTSRKVIMQPYQPEIIGNDLSDYRDVKGNLLFREIVEMVNNNQSGFVDYTWQWKDIPDKTSLKVSYVHLFKPWAWIVGSGFYVVDVEQELSVIKRKVFYYSAIVIVIIVLLSFYISYRTYKTTKEKEEAERAFFDSQEKYKEIVENANTAILKIDLQGDITFFNEYAQKLFGFKKDEIIGKNVVGTILPSNKKSDYSLEDVQHIIKNYHEFERNDNWNITKTGERKYISWNNKPIFNSDNELTGVISIGTDITERKQLIDELAESQKKFKTIFNSVSDGIIIFTVSGKIVEANETAYKRSGYTKEEYLQFPMQAFLSQHPVLNFDSLVEELGGKDFISIEVSYHSKSEQLINIEVVAKKMIYEGQEAYLAVTREITERIEIQHKIYNAVLEAEEKERSRVAKELHDGVSPLLSTIKLFSQSLKDCHTDELRQEILKKIEETINESIQSISDISNNLSPHILQNFGLIPALENFIEKISDSKPLKFHFEANINSKLGSMLDVTIYRIVTELVNNTLKYARAKNVFITLSENEVVYLKYKDDGIGFDYNTTIENKKGMGLFNISNRVKSLKGYARFLPEPGKGVKVEIEIPKQ